MKTLLQLLPLFLSLLTALAFLGCQGHTSQTTSGQAYLASSGRPELGASGSATPAANIDEEVARVAAVEPQLRFPARIGLVKIFRGQISNLTPEEAAAWDQAQSDLGPAFGTFIPVSPLIAEMVSEAPSQARPNATEIIRKIRLGAARQHLDAVLIYEVFSATQSTSLPSQVAVWTIIGAYLVPSEKVETIGYANALLLDVRNGYPYGTAQVSAEKKDVTLFFNHRDQTRELESANQITVALKLIPEAQALLRRLLTELSALPPPHPASAPFSPES